jgi:hypothetical protein
MSHSYTATGSRGLQEFGINKGRQHLKHLELKGQLDSVEYQDKEKPSEEAQRNNYVSLRVPLGPNEKDRVGLALGMKVTRM